MKLTEKNIKKHLKDHEDLLKRCEELLHEMGVHFIDIDSKEVFFEYVEEDNILKIIDWKDKSFIKIPVSYLLDKEGDHEEEYKKELEKEKQLQLKRYKDYL